MTSANTTCPVSTESLAGKYLTFSVKKESYGIDVLQVREIIRLTSITAVPQMPAHVRGVINLRGKIIPVMDLCAKLGIADSGESDQTCIIVVQARSAAGKLTQMGLVVGGVEEVTNIAAEEIEPCPDFGVEIASHHILGIAKIKGAVKTLLKLTSILDL